MSVICGVASMMAFTEEVSASMTCGARMSSRCVPQECQTRKMSNKSAPQGRQFRECCASVEEQWPTGVSSESAR